MFQQPAFRLPVECRIKVDGQELIELYPYLREANVKMCRNTATVCTLKFNSIRTEKKGEWIVQDDPRLQPWKKIVIEAKFSTYTEEIIRGYINEVQTEYPKEMSGVQVVVSGQDESLYLDRNHENKCWDSTITDGTIATELASDNGFTAQVEQGLTHETICCNSTPIKFLKERAEANGFELYLRESVLYFQQPQLSANPQPTIMVYAGLATNCYTFSVSYDGHKPDQVLLQYQDGKSTEVKEKKISPNLKLLGQSEATSSKTCSQPFIWKMTHRSGSTVEEWESEAQAKANENAWKIVADGELDGALYGHVLQNYKTVAVDGIGTTYGGLYYVDSVEHCFSMDGYRQRFRLLRNALGEDALAMPFDQLSLVR
jgi:phage protein D